VSTKVLGNPSPSHSPSTRKLVERLIRTVFPGVARRFDISAEYYREIGIEPLFGVYWNLCVNAAFPMQPRIHCGPHVDQKNIVGICTLLVYELPILEYQTHLRIIPIPFQITTYSI
jgi:hypothetical protein